MANVPPDRFSLIAQVQFQNETEDFGISVSGETSHELQLSSQSDDVRSGARFLAGVADDLKAQLDALKARVDACCGAMPSPIAPPSDAKTGPSAHGLQGALASFFRFLTSSPWRSDPCVNWLSRPWRY